MTTRRLKLILTFCTLTILFSCGGDSTVTFDKPQPDNTDNLSRFPKRLQGQFQSTADNSTLTLTDKLILRIYDLDFKVHINQLDSNYKVSGDTVINIKEREEKIIKREGDTLIEHIHSIDTLFAISEDNVLKRFKGYYFLNYLHYKDNWDVKKLGLHRGQLSISSVSTKVDIDLLKEISESAVDSLPYQFKPTKRQFKKFVKADGFSDTETFMKIK